MWKTVSKVLNRGTAETAFTGLNVDGTKVTGDQRIAETADHHFTAFGQKLAAQIRSLLFNDPLKFIRNRSLARIKLKLIGNTQMLKYLQNSKPGKANGTANIPAKLLKDSGEDISQPLCQTFNSWLTTGFFPELSKVARVAPIFNIGSRDDLNN